ncbi:MAG TPA: hypothetical protein VMI54_20230 [Polyangiaceae bacterium]|nr:hypothetical protein [Polyangiaceae bacterium]
MGRLLPSVFALALGGCVVDSGYHDGYYDNGYPGGYSPPPSGSYPICSSGVDQQGIDTGQILELDPGYVGVTAEYFGNGAWRFAMACDTPSSGAVCNYVVTVTPVNGAIASYAPEGLEQNDILSTVPGAYGADAVHLDALTSTDLDGFTLQADPGSTLEVEVTLDGNCAASYLFWVEGNNVVSGQRTLTDLTPSAP